MILRRKLFEQRLTFDGGEDRRLDITAGELLTFGPFHQFGHNLPRAVTWTA